MTTDADPLGDGDAPAGEPTEIAATDDLAGDGDAAGFGDFGEEPPVQAAADPALGSEPAFGGEPAFQDEPAEDETFLAADDAGGWGDYEPDAADVVPVNDAGVTVAADEPPAFEATDDAGDFWGEDRAEPVAVAESEPAFEPEPASGDAWGVPAETAGAADAFAAAAADFGAGAADITDEFGDEAVTLAGDFGSDANGFAEDAAEEFTEDAADLFGGAETAALAAADAATDAAEQAMPALFDEGPAEPQTSEEPAADFGTESFAAADPPADEPFGGPPAAGDAEPTWGDDAADEPEPAFLADAAETGAAADEWGFGATPQVDPAPLDPAPEPAAAPAAEPAFAWGEPDPEPAAEPAFAAAEEPPALAAAEDAFGADDFGADAFGSDDSGVSEPEPAFMPEPEPVVAEAPQVAAAPPLSAPPVFAAAEPRDRDRDAMTDAEPTRDDAVRPAAATVPARFRWSGPDDRKVATVLPGETYWAISKRCYGDVKFFKALARYNARRITDPRKLKPGMKVVCPAPAVLRPYDPDLLAGAERRARPKPVASKGYGFDERGRPVFVVGPDDTLGGIARATLGKASRWRQIYALNRDKIADPDRLKPGTLLDLPADAGGVRRR